MPTRSDADSDRFTAFYRMHRGPAMRWALSLVGRPDVAEELAHEALWRTGTRLDALADPAAYLRRAVVNACRSWHRSRAREQHRLRLVATDDPQVDVSADTLEIVEALATLPYRRRAAIVLRYWAGWSDSEIGDALGCRSSNVRVLVHRGLATLRNLLDERGQQQ